MTYFTFNSVQNSERTAAGKLSLSLNATLTMKFEELQGQASAVDKRAMCLCVSVSEIEKYMPLQHVTIAFQIKKAWQQAIHLETCKIHSFKVLCFPLFLTRPSKLQQFITIWLILHQLAFCEMFCVKMEIN